MSAIIQSELYHIPIPGLKILFEAAAQHANLIFWMRSIDYKKQIYVSETFTKVFGISITTFIANPSSFDSFVIPEDFQSFKTIDNKRIIKTDEIQSDFNYYRIVNMHGQVKQMCDRSFPIFDRQGRQVAIAGIAGDITHHIQQDARFLRPQQHLVDDINILFAEVNKALGDLKLIANEKPIVLPSQIIANKPYLIDGQHFSVSTRQADCINYALQGKTIKQIARQLNLSPRTVEEHLNILKNKLACSNKVQLVTKFAKVLDK